MREKDTRWVKGEMQTLGYNLIVEDDLPSSKEEVGRKFSDLDNFMNRMAENPDCQKVFRDLNQGLISRKSALSSISAIMAKEKENNEEPSPEVLN